MKPAPSETQAEILHRVRQQLILAQVRIMELEDGRDELISRLARLDRTLTEMQSIAQERIAERDHQARLAVDLEKQSELLRQQLGETHQSLHQSQTGVVELQSTLERSERSATEHQVLVADLTAQLRALKTSRSWRWTAPLRSLERLFRRSSRE
jgi:hypothetical protein